MVKHYTTELVGTFLYVLSAALLGSSKHPELAPFAVGAIVMAMTYIGGSAPGTHLNPAISLAVYLRGRLDSKDLGPYIAAQIGGAIAAVLLARWISGAEFSPAPTNRAAFIPAVVVESIFSFGLCLVVLKTTVSRAAEGNSYYGAAIGFTLAAIMLVGAEPSGGVYNPAIGISSFAISLVATTPPMNHWWIYLVGPFLGAAMATGLFMLQHPDDK